MFMLRSTVSCIWNNIPSIHPLSWMNISGWGANPSQRTLTGWLAGVILDYRPLQCFKILLLKAQLFPSLWQSGCILSPDPRAVRGLGIRWRACHSVSPDTTSRLPGDAPSLCAAPTPTAMFLPPHAGLTPPSPGTITAL